MLILVFIFLLIPSIKPMDPLDLRIRHSHGIEKHTLCIFDVAPPDLDLDELLADIRPRLVGNVLSSGAFGATRSVKWQFGRYGGLESVKGITEETLAWAKPLVDAFAAPQADLFVLNALSVPCGSEVAGHYDDTIIGERTGLRVSVLYVDLPPEGSWTGGEFHAYRSRADALSGQGAACKARPFKGGVLHFRGDLFHGVAKLQCTNHALVGQERISVVLEQYSMADFPLVVSVEVDSGARVEELWFKATDDATTRLHAASVFAERHQLLGGSGCDGIACVAGRIAERMEEQIKARVQAMGQTLGASSEQ